jgi:predicted NBD/HSP70 family sugar kinase
MTNSGFNQKNVRERNRLSFLRIIRDYGPLTRSQAGEMLGLSNTTCMEMSRNLSSRGFIREKGQGDSSGGRRPTLLEINWEYSFVLGMILSQEGVSCGVYDLKLNRKSIVNHREALSDKYIIHRITECARDAMEQSGLTEKEIACMTIGVGGIVDAAKSNVIGSTHFHTGKIIHIHDELDKIFSFPLYLENYGNLLALAEKKLFYPHKNSLAFIQVDTGIGGGIIYNNSIIRGANGFAAEIGHMTIEKNGPLCFCGNRGCVEVLGSIPALLQKASFGLLIQPDSLIRQYAGENPISIDAIARAFDAQDRLAEQLFEEEADILYRTVLNIIVTHDPEVIVIGGDINQFGEALLDHIRESLANTIFNNETRIISFSRLANDPRISGAGMYAIESFFTEPMRQRRHTPPEGGV